MRVKIHNLGTVNLTVSGTYIITAIARGISGSQYFEKLELTSTGPGNNNPSLF